MMRVSKKESNKVLNEKAASSSEITEVEEQRPKAAPEQLIPIFNPISVVYQPRCGRLISGLQQEGPGRGGDHPLQPGQVLPSVSLEGPVQRVNKLGSLWNMLPWKRK